MALCEGWYVEAVGLRLSTTDRRERRTPRQQLVRGVRGEHQRARTRTPRADRVHVLIKVVELGMRHPGFVEVERVEQVAEQVLDHLNVVDHAVISTLRDGQDARFCLRILRQRLTR